MNQCFERCLKPITCAVGLALGAGMGAQADDGRAALLEAPQLMEPAVVADFGEMTPEQVRGLLKIVSGRTYAYYGFNTPELQIHLPLVDNSTYAKVEMPEPKLFDAAGREVPYELERGLHDFETQIAEIRFLSADGESPAEFARVVGEITVIYPLVVETRTVVSGASDAGVRIDGPYVDVVDGTLPEAAPFSLLEPGRAYDAAGRQVKRSPTSSTRMVDGRAFQRLVFHGAVARVELDRIVRTVELAIRYDVPISEALGERQKGVALADERDVVQHPESRINIEIGALGGASAPLVGPGEAVPILGRGDLSAEARVFAEAITALEQVIPESPAIVQLVVFPPSLLNVSLERASRETGSLVEEWSWSNGAISGPSALDTQWLQCKRGMPTAALTLQRVPTLWDDATRRVGAGARPLQLIVGQSPCGKPFINVPFDNGQRVEYEGDGRFVKME